MSGAVRALRANLEDWAGAAKNAGEALAVDGDNFKALYRLFLANFRRGALHEAKPMLLRACKLDPENKTARRELCGAEGGAQGEGGAAPREDERYVQEESLL